MVLVFAVLFGSIFGFGIGSGFGFSFLLALVGLTEVTFLRHCPENIEYRLSSRESVVNILGAEGTSMYKVENV